MSVERIAEAAEGWSVRWERATGLAVAVGSDGIPVCFVDGLTHEGVQRGDYPKFRFIIGELDGWYRVEQVLLKCAANRGMPVVALHARP